MTAVQVHGTSDPAEIAAVLAILRHEHAPQPALDGIAAWRQRRRAAIAGAARSAVRPARPRG